jgi:UDP-GlcNAc:undecaprenyl-phosphate GlcNAc-1-phosphate transferase
MTTIFWLILAFLLSYGAGLILTPLIIRSAGALKLYDAPDGDRRLHDEPVPRLGGIAVYLAAAATACLLFIRTSPLFITPGTVGDGQLRFLTGAFIGSAFLFLVGVVDDIRGLSAGLKLGAQIIAASIAYFFGADLGTVALGYGQGVSIGFLEFPFLLLWIVGVTNVFNFIDGLNGLAAGVAVVACAAIVIAGAVLGNFSILLPSVALAAATLGFLRYNFPRAQIFLGDSGSLSIGFLLAVFLLQASRGPSGAVIIVIPLLALFVPLIDGLLAVLRRWLRNVPLSGADARHIHHRLLALGITPRKTAVLLWSLAAAMAGFGLLIALTAPFVATSVALLGLVGLSVIVIYGTNLLAYHELIVAGEVLASAPSRARRVISDQILATDLTSLIAHAENVDDLTSLLEESAAQFGFLAMELSGDDVGAREIRHDRILAQNWGWKLDYPIRTGDDTSKPAYVLSIWCSSAFSARPYGAERVARVIGPALQHWFKKRSASTAIGDTGPQPVLRGRFLRTRRLRTD